MTETDDWSYGQYWIIWECCFQSTINIDDKIEPMPKCSNLTGFYPKKEKQNK